MDESVRSDLSDPEGVGEKAGDGGQGTAMGGDPAPSGGASSSFPALDSLPLADYIRLVQIHARLRRNLCVFLFSAGAMGPAAFLILLAGSFEIPAAAAAARLALPLLAILFALIGPAASRFIFRSPQKTARKLIEPALPDGSLKSGFIPALELQEQLENGSLSSGDFSEQLALAHIQSVEAALSRVEPGSIIPAGKTARAFKFAFAAFFASLAAGFFFGGRMEKGADFIINSDAAIFQSESGDASAGCDTVSDEPVVGNLLLTLSPPAYSGREVSVIENGDGTMRGLKGTDVLIQAAAGLDLSAASIVFSDGETLPLSVEEGRRISGRMTLTRNTGYRFRLEPSGMDQKKKGGFQLFSSPSGSSSSRERGEICSVTGPNSDIFIEQDAPPVISMESPQTDLEVQSDGEIRIVYEAADDFGISEVALLYRLPGTSAPKRVSLRIPRQPEKNISGEYVLSLAGLALSPEDQLAFYLEALDNDAMDGPKRSVTGTRTAVIFSRSARRREMAERLAQVWEKLIQLLADRLEAPELTAGRPGFQEFSTGKAVDERASALAAEMISAVQSAADGPEGVKYEDLELIPEQISAAFVNAGRTLEIRARETTRRRAVLLSSLKAFGGGHAAVEQRQLRKALAEEITSLERSIIYLETLLDEQRTESLRDDAASLSEQRRALADILEKLRDSGDDDPEAKSHAFAEIARLKSQMAELFSRMSQLARSIQDAHVNEEALRELTDAGKSMNAFDRMQDMLAAGDIESAMKALDEIAQALETLERKLDGIPEELGEDLDGELVRDLDRFSSGLDDLIRAQEGVLQKSKEAFSREEAHRKKVIREKGKDFLAGLEEKVQKALDLVGAIVTTQAGRYVEEGVSTSLSSLGDLAVALKVGDYDRASGFASESAERLRLLTVELERQKRFFSWRASAEKIRQQTEDLERSGKARQLIEEVDQALRDLKIEAGGGEDKDKNGESGEQNSGQEKEDLSALAEEQGALSEKTAALKSRMEAVNRLAPIFPDEARELLSEAEHQISSAKSGLEASNPSQAVRSGQAALDFLNALKKGLEGEDGSEGDSGEQGEEGSGGDSASQAQQGGSGSGAGAGGEMEISGSGGTPGRKGRQAQSGASGKNGVGRRGQKGLALQGRGIPRPWGQSRSPGRRRGDSLGRSLMGMEKVQIPLTNDAETMEKFRREVLEGMKGRAPQEYREEVKRYYEEIIH